MDNKRSFGKELNTVYDVIKATKSVFELAPEDISGLQTLAIESLSAGKYQPRKVFEQDTLQNLAESIRQNGIIQPIIVRKTTDGYEIIAGERRWLAAKIAELKEVPVVIYNIDDKLTLAFSLVENLQREELNPIEQANAFSYLQHEFKLTHSQIAEQVGFSRALVSNMIRLLTLPHSIKDMLVDKQLTFGHARAILSLDKELQLKLAKKIIDNSLSVRQTEELVQKAKEGVSSHTCKQNIIEDKESNKLNALILSERLAARVSIQGASKGYNKIIIDTESKEQFDRLLQSLNINSQD